MGTDIGYVLQYSFSFSKNESTVRCSQALTASKARTTNSHCTCAFTRHAVFLGSALTLNKSILSIGSDSHLHVLSTLSRLAVEATSDGLPVATFASSTGVDVDRHGKNSGSKSPACSVSVRQGTRHVAQVLLQV
jgi:hypothetical protein